MAISKARPKVKVAQEITKTSPTVVIPTLQPCIIGPCYQILEPLTALGEKNPAAAVTTAAKAIGTTVGATLSLSGKKIKVSVNSGLGQTISFPTTINGVAISQQLAVNAINRQLTGATASFVNNQLVIKVGTKGATSRLLLQTIADDGYAELGLDDFVDLPLYGSGAYSGQEIAVSFSDLPSPKAPVADVVFDTTDLGMYRLFAGEMKSFRDDASPAWNAYVGGASKSGAVAYSRTAQPALGGAKHTLFGVRATSTKTNAIASLGKDASVVIPMVGYANTDADYGASTGMAWPDPEGTNYLMVEAFGTQDYVASSSGLVGPYVGALGNDVSVVLDVTAALGAVEIAFDADVLTINIPADCTFAQLKTAIDAVTFTDVRITLSYGALHIDSKCVMPDGSTPSGVGTFYLNGGVDPVDFGDDAPGVTSCGVTGSVGLAAGATGDDLGLTGKSIFLSASGGPWVEAVFLAATSVFTTMNTAFSASIGVAVSQLDSNIVKNGLVETFRPVRFLLSDELHHDSTLQIEAIPAVIETLLGGFKTRTAAAAAMTFVAGGYSTTKRAATIAQTVYNPLATVRGEKSLVPGSVTMAVKSTILPAFVLASSNNYAGLVVGDNTITFDYNGVETTLTASVAALTTDGIVTAIKAALTLAAITTVGCANANGYVCLFDAAGNTAISGLKVVTSDPADDLTALFAGLEDVVSTTATGTVTLADNGTAYAVRVISISNSMAHGAFSPDVLDVTQPSSLTTFMLDSTLCSFYYSASASVDAGLLTIGFAHDGATDGAGDPVAVTARKCVFAKLAASPTVDVTYSRLWSCSAAASSASYTSRVFSADSHEVLPGDMVFNGTTVLGRVNEVASLILGGTVYAGAKLILSEYSVSNAAILRGWHIDAHGLDAADNARLAPELSKSAVNQKLTLKHALNRTADGIPTAGNAPMYTGYKALRLDVTAAKVKDFLLLTDTELDDAIGPVSVDNPLAWAMFCATLAAPGVRIGALGVSAVTADASFGTLAAYQEAASFLANKEAYALATCVQDRAVADLMSTSVLACSDPDVGKERIAFVNLELPTEKNPIVAASGNATIEDIGGGKYELTFDDDAMNVVTALDGLEDANGDTISAAVGTDFGAAAGIYLDRAGDPYKWLITKIVGVRTVQIEVNDIYLPGSGPGTGGNDDGYFQTDSASLADFEIDGEFCAVLVRQEAISTATAAGRVAICEALADIARSYANRRLFIVMPNFVTMDVNGTSAVVHGFYAAAQVAAMCGALPPQQSFSNYPMVGFTGVSGSSDIFSDEEMGIARAGGVYWIVQDSAGAPLVCAHQLSTDTSDVKTQELSITKPVDVYAKAIRSALKARTGRNNITKSFLTDTGLALQAIAGSMAGEGKELAEAALTVLAQNPNKADGIVARSVVSTWIPCNEIEVTIVN